MNAYSQVKSIGQTKSDLNSFSFSSNDYIDSFLGPFFLNKGIVLNVEDFGGRIEIFGNSFDRNFHYIPSILYNGESKGNLQLS